MANPATLATIRTRCRQRADKVNSTFVTDAELNELINQAWTELYGLLVANYEDYYATLGSLSVSANVEYTALPTDFYKALAIFSLSGAAGTTRQKLERYNVNDLGAVNADYAYSFQRLSGYRIMGANAYWYPKPQAASTVEFWYIPQPVRLVLDGDVISPQVVDGWDEFIVNDVAMKIRLKEEGDASPHAELKAAFIKRVQSESASRDAARPGRVTDVERCYYDWWGR